MKFVFMLILNVNVIFFGAEWYSINTVRSKIRSVRYRGQRILAGGGIVEKKKHFGKEKTFWQKTHILAKKTHTFRGENIFKQKNTFSCKKTHFGKKDHVLAEKLSWARRQFSAKQNFRQKN